MTTSENMRFLLSRRGRLATLTQPNYGSYDTTTGSVASGTPDTYTVKCYFAEFSLGEDNTDNIALGTRMVAVSPVDTSGVSVPTPTVEDTISGVGDTVRVVKTQEIFNGDTLVCYICHVKE